MVVKESTPHGAVAVAEKQKSLRWGHLGHFGQWARPIIWRPRPTRPYHLPHRPYHRPYRPGGRNFQIISLTHNGVFRQIMAAFGVCVCFLLGEFSHGTPCNSGW